MAKLYDEIADRIHMTYYPPKLRTNAVIKKFVELFEKKHGDKPTQREIAERLQIGLRTVQRYFKGNSNNAHGYLYDRPFDANDLRHFY